jgi:hypothetical protein
VANSNDPRTKVNATVLGTVHDVITPLPLLSRGTAMVPYKQQDSRRATAAKLNMTGEEGGRNGEN